MQAIRSDMGAFTLKCGILSPPNTNTIYSECCTKVSRVLYGFKGYDASMLPDDASAASVLPVL